MNLINRVALPLAVAAATLIGANATHAQYTGPSAEPHVKNVKDALDNGLDDQNVQLTGRIIKQLGDEDYVFADDSGQINVEIDDDDMPPEPISETTSVTIHGEIDVKRLRPNEIDVDRVSVNAP